MFKRTARLFRPFRYQMMFLVVLLTLTAICEMASVRLLGLMVDEITSGGGRLTALFALFGAAAFGMALCGFGQAYVNETIGQNVVQRLRSDLHTHIQSLPVSFFSRTRSGEVMSRLTTDVNAVQGAISGTFTEFLSSLMTLLIAFVLMCAMSWQMALVTLVVLPLWVYPTVRVGRTMRRLRGAWHAESARMHSQLDETLSVSGAMLVKAFARTEYEAERFATSNARMRDLALRRLIAGRWFTLSTSLFAAIIPGVVYWYGGRQVLGGGSLSTGDVVAFAMLAQRVFEPFATLARLNTTVLSSAAMFERIFEYLDIEQDVVEKSDAVVLTRPRGALEFDGVSFAYPGADEMAVHDVSFRALPGSMVALVGHSGAGKTTVGYLLQRFYDPTQGAVRIDGHDLRDLTADSISESVGAVMQETYLFHASLERNIRYGRLDATDAELAEAARIAGLGPLIARLPEGLETVVGERGFRLSGGERQRVSIARAVLKDPPVLLLDEATSALDSRLEQKIQEATEQLSHGRTTVVIAHRLSTVVRADQILVFDSGHIVEAGDHTSLLARGGAYAELYRTQFAADPAPDLTAASVSAVD
nr:ABC transporter ATP-binding protein [Micromonospora sp. DSM 115978]